MSQKALIVVPCYNEAARINLAAFKAYAGEYVFLFVNDGSTDNTVEVIKPYCNDVMLLLDLGKNQGKAEAVRQGLLHALTLPVMGDIEWIGFWDADLATPLEELDNFFKFREIFSPKAQVILGSRVRRLGSTVKRKFARHLLGRLFATVADSLFHLGAYDTQCGAKIFKKHLVPSFANEPFVSSWAFDVELLTRIRGVEMVEYPLTTWQDVAGSKLKISRVAPRILMDFYVMNKKYNSKPGLPPQENP